MKFTNTEVFNIEGAIRGMRNPLNSWDKSDSYYDIHQSEYIIGEKDLNLAQRLLRGGNEHAKFMRQIFVTVDITAPLYWWKEMDTYKVGTTANSTSTMHTLTKNPITKNSFQFDEIYATVKSIKVSDSYTFDYRISDMQDLAIEMCENLRQKFLDTFDEYYWRALVQLLPNAYLQTRTWTANYAVLRNIYFQRYYHRLTEWHEFCKWVETLPYSKELIMLEEKDETN